MPVARIATWSLPGFSAFWVLALAVIGSASAPVFAADEKGAPAQPKDETLTTDDGVNIHITYYKSTGEKEAPVVVLLHMKDGNRFNWGAKEDGLAKTLQDAGYAVVTVDLRHHGESKLGGTVVGAATPANKKKGKKGSGLDLKPVEYELMVGQDMEAVKHFIYAEHQAGRLNMNKMVIVGAEMGASIAAFYAILDWDKTPYEDAPQAEYRTPRGQDVRALVLISPQEKFHGLLMSKAIQVLKGNPGIAFFVCNGNDPKDEAQSKKLFDMIKAPVFEKQRMAQRTYQAKLQGTDLLGKRLGIEDDIVAFLDGTVKKLDTPWRDRRSKRERLESKKK